MTDVEVKTEAEVSPTPLSEEAVRNARRLIVRADRMVDGLLRPKPTNVPGGKPKKTSKRKKLVGKEEPLPDRQIIHTLEYDQDDWNSYSSAQEGSSMDVLTEDENMIVDVQAYRWRRETLEYRMEQMRQRMAENSLPFEERPAFMLTPEDMSYFPLSERNPYGDANRDRWFPKTPVVVPDLRMPSFSYTPKQFVLPGSDAIYMTMLRQALARIVLRSSRYTHISSQALNVLTEVTGSIISRIFRAMRVRYDNLEQYTPVKLSQEVPTLGKDGQPIVYVKVPLLSPASSYAMLNRALLDVGFHGFFTILKHVKNNPECLGEKEVPPEPANESSPQPEAGKDDDAEKKVKIEDETDSKPKEGEKKGEDDVETEMKDGDDDTDKNVKTEPEEEQPEKGKEEDSKEKGDDDDDDAMTDVKPSETQEAAESEEAATATSEKAEDDKVEVKKDSSITEEDSKTAEHEKNNEAEPTDEIEEVESPVEKDPAPAPPPPSKRRTRSATNSSNNRKQEPPASSPVPASEEEQEPEEDRLMTRSARRRGGMKRLPTPSSMVLRKESPTRRKRI